MICAQGRGNGDSVSWWGKRDDIQQKQEAQYFGLEGKAPTIVPPLEGNPDVLVPKIRAKTKVTNYETKSY